MHRADQTSLRFPEALEVLVTLSVLLDQTSLVSPTPLEIPEAPAVLLNQSHLVDPEILTSPTLLEIPGTLVALSL